MCPGWFTFRLTKSDDPKEKLPSASLEGCFGDGSRSRIGAPEAPGECSRDVRKGLSDSQRCRISKPERRIGGPANSHRCRIPRPGSLRAGYAVILQWIAWWLRPAMSDGNPSPQPPVLFSKLPFSPVSFGWVCKASPHAGPGGRRIWGWGLGGWGLGAGCSGLGAGVLKVAHLGLGAGCSGPDGPVLPPRVPQAAHPSKEGYGGCWTQRNHFATLPIKCLEFSPPRSSQTPPPLRSRDSTIGMILRESLKSAF